MLSAPSGAGKSSIATAAAKSGEIELSISCTTRAPRPNETDGVSYLFVDEAAFAAKRDAGDLLEHANVHGNWYGTPKPWITERMEAGKDILLEIDWQGARQVREKIPGAVSVFVLPPSMGQLRARLVGRGEDSDEVIRQRLAAAPAEMSHAEEYDYVIINRDLARSVEDFLSIVRTSRMRYSSLAREVGAIVGQPAPNQETKADDGEDHS